jgi:hypothetical protein
MTLSSSFALLMLMTFFGLAPPTASFFFLSKKSMGFDFFFSGRVSSKSSSSDISTSDSCSDSCLAFGFFFCFSGGVTWMRVG